MTDESLRVRVPGPFRYRDLPEDVVYVGRAAWGYPASPYANPHVVGKPCRLCDGRVHDAPEAVAEYGRHLDEHPELVERARQELPGRRLGCWCQPPAPCHVDALLAAIYG